MSEEYKNPKENGVSVVLGSYNRKKFLKLTVETIRQELTQAEFPSEIIIVDGGSTDGTLRWLSQQKDIITIVQHNRGTWHGKKIQRRSWGYFMNLGFKCAHYKYICMVSDDCLVVPKAIINGYHLFEQQLRNGKNVGAVAFYWRNWPDQKKYWVGLTLGNKMFVNHGIYLHQALKDVNYIDEDNFNFYHADGDLCLKLWQNGYSVIDSPDSFIEHFSHTNSSLRKSNLEGQKEDKENYLKKWEGFYYQKGDPNWGSWKEKDFVDTEKTCKKFQKFRIEIIRHGLIKFLSEAKEKVLHV